MWAYILSILYFCTGKHKNVLHVTKYDTCDFDLAVVDWY